MKNVPTVVIDFIVCFSNKTILSTKLHHVCVIRVNDIKELLLSFPGLTASPSV
jgi:hypothetical protein